MRARVRVPATTANLGPGFDVVGMALSLYNEVELEEIAEGLVISAEGEGVATVAYDASNLIVQAAERVFQEVGYAPTGLRVRCVNAIPMTRGLGSSSAALVGGLLAANAISGERLSKQRLLEIATEMEGHPDNVAPALYGGIVVSGQVGGALRSVFLQPPAGLSAVVAIPDFELPTSEARNVLPAQVSRQDAIFTAAHVGLMMAALMRGDLELFGAAMEDVLHQPYRATLIPGMPEVLAAAKAAGALGVALSGAGPTMIALVRESDATAAAVGDAMRDAFAAHGVTCRVVELPPDGVGAHNIEEVMVEDTAGLSTR